jgi:hypothetical protein
MSLKTIIQEAAVLVGVPRPQVAMAATDLAVQQLVAHAQREISSLADEFAWPTAIGEHKFKTVAASEQPSGLPPDFDRIINGSMWNRTRNIQVKGPISPQDWQRAQVEPGVLISEMSWRIRGVRLQLWPVPSKDDEIAFEFVSKRIIQSGPVKEWVWKTDDDVALIDESLITLGVIWRFKAAKGLSYDEDMANYERAKGRIMAFIGGAPTLHIDGGRCLGGPTDPQVPEGSWGAA